MYNNEGLAKSMTSSANRLNMDKHFTQQLKAIRWAGWLASDWAGRSRLCPLTLLVMSHWWIRCRRKTIVYRRLLAIFLDDRGWDGDVDVDEQRNLLSFFSPLYLYIWRTLCIAKDNKQAFSSSLELFILASFFLFLLLLLRLFLILVFYTQAKRKKERERNKKATPTRRATASSSSVGV